MAEEASETSDAPQQQSQRQGSQRSDDQRANGHRPEQEVVMGIPATNVPQGRPPGAHRLHSPGPHRPPQNPQPRPPRSPFAAAPSVIRIAQGQDIVEAIRSFLDLYKQSVVRNNDQHFYMEACILGAVGDIAHPTIQVDGSLTTYEGHFPIANLSGQFIVRFNRPTQLDHVFLTFQPEDECIGGYVAGPLLGASIIQVTIGCFTVMGQ